MSDKMKSSNLYFPEFGGSTGGWLEAAEAFGLAIPTAKASD